MKQNLFFMNGLIKNWLFKINERDQQMINTLTSCFKDNARMKKLIDKSGRAFISCLEQLLSYIILSIKENGYVYKTSNKKSFILYYRQSEFYLRWKDKLRYAFIAFNVIGLNRLKKVYASEQKIKSIRTKHQLLNAHHDFLYVWFLAQDRSYNSIDSLVEIKRYIMDKADFLNIPIYIETTEERLVPLYARMGFSFYDSFQDEEKNLTIYFAKYEPFLQTISQKIAA